ncbi:aminotransferase class III-fold pyridoxal phosphate-dependent enzyme [uncultured Cellulomonas sp.]|uniref:aminotransferase class III-fold pyridoxal phosphate-dependent enzyme n=1 Tax=uncultured Cellulomonas sp. TaxID=189682 RepID=UPI0028E3E546|nr:aminotransferase class III-fold pyridoxal phosphate-dependent enzyme [uncultured Cellulomonas sp.]
MEFLDGLREEFPQVAEVVVHRFEKHVGLQGSLSVLFAETRAEFGVHLEDDWEFFGTVPLDQLIRDLDAHDSSEIAFANTHVARGGTFEVPGVVTVPGAEDRLIRLPPDSWAADYLPLCPHVHKTARWVPALAAALVTSDAVRCPDERMRERVIETGARDQHNVLWTREVIVRDIGREWLAARRRFKRITPSHSGTVPVAAPPVDPVDRPLVLDRSLALQDRAARLIPGLTQTFQKRPEQFAPGAYPVYLERGAGSRVWDVDGRSYVDFVCGLGAASLGHDHPVVTDTIRERAGRGVILSLPTAVEITAAESLRAAVRPAEMIRFLKSGAEACSAAIRLARAVTGREEILVAGYHGWHDALGGKGPGVPAEIARLTERIDLVDTAADALFIDRLETRGTRYAAVVISAPYHRVLPDELLRDIRRKTRDAGVVLVLDEIVTGFRVAPGGIGELSGVDGDLLCFSKGLAAGMPLAALAGRRDVMEHLGSLHVSTTFGGEMLSLHVMRAALQEYAGSDYYSHIAELGRRLRDGLNEQAAELGAGAVARGYDPMPCLWFADRPDEHTRRATVFVAEMARRGFLMRRDVNFVSASHQRADVDAALEASRPSLAAALGEVLP